MYISDQRWFPSGSYVNTVAVVLNSVSSNSVIWNKVDDLTYLQALRAPFLTRINYNPSMDK